MTVIKCQHQPQTSCCLGECLLLCSQCFEDHLEEMPAHQECGLVSRQVIATRTQIKQLQALATLWTSGLTQEECDELEGEIFFLGQELVSNLETFKHKLLWQYYQAVAASLRRVASQPHFLSLERLEEELNSI
jgi:hypothetical protein